eukprot:7750815-Lingulodinium_polyedra.AAC.1
MCIRDRGNTSRAETDVALRTTLGWLAAGGGRAAPRLEMRRRPVLVNPIHSRSAAVPRPHR